MSAQNTVYPVPTWLVSDYFRHETSGKYFGAPLPESIEEEPFDIDESSYITLKIVSGDAPHILATKFEGTDDEAGRYEMSVQKREDRHPSYFIQFPSEFTNHNESSPVYGIQKGDDLNVEIDFSNAEIRIYRAEDYGLRSQELSAQGESPLVKAPFLLGLYSGMADYIDDQPGVEWVWINSLPRTASSGEMLKIEGIAIGTDLDKMALKVRKEGETVWDHFKSKSCSRNKCSMERRFHIQDSDNLEFKVSATAVNSEYKDSRIEKVRVQ